ADVVPDRLSPLAERMVEVALNGGGELRLVPGVDEVRVRRKLAARGQLSRRAARDVVVDEERERGHLDGVRARAHTLRGIGHVALVVRAVEPAPVPAVREVDLQA